MKVRSLALVGTGCAFVLAVACSSSSPDDDTPAAGSSGTAAGTAGIGGSTGGAGSGNAGTAGTTAGASAGSSPAGAGGAGTGGTPAAGTAGAAGSTAGAGTAGSGGSAGSTQAGCRIPATEQDVPMLLSETGCVDVTDPAKPVPGTFPYAVNSPLWSDGAGKERFLALPPGMTIHVKDCDAEPDTCMALESGGTAEEEGHFGLPVGTVLVKNFAIGEKRVETRLLMRFTETAWRGFSYEWNDAETDATLLPDFKDKPVGDQTWHYPSRTECLDCHTKAAGRSLGPTTAQLDRDYTYPDGTSANQLDRMVELGYLSAKPKAIPAYPDPYGDAPLEQRARSYLQSNCSICHRAGGTISDVDLRFLVSFADTKLCNQPVIREDTDPMVPQVRLVPGDHEASNLSFRMHDRAGYKMPKIGSNVVDPMGSALIDEWIDSLTGCP